MYGFFPSESSRFKSARTEAEMTRYLHDLVVNDTEQKFFEYCKQNGIAESYEFIRLVATLNESHDIPKKIEEIFNISINRSSTLAININFDKVEELMSVYGAFQKGNKPVDDVIALLEKTMNVVLILIVGNIPTFDHSMRQRLLMREVGTPAASSQGTTANTSTPRCCTCTVS